MTHRITNHYENRSVLASLRTVIPARDRITFAEALRVAELHANRLLELHRINDGPTPSDLIAELPKLEKLDLRWNEVHEPPAALIERGCVVLCE